MKRFLNILRYVFWLLVIIPPMLFWAMVIGYVFDEVGIVPKTGKFGIIMKNAAEMTV